MLRRRRIAVGRLGGVCPHEVAGVGQLRPNASVGEESASHGRTAKYLPTTVECATLPLNPQAAAGTSTERMSNGLKVMGSAQWIRTRIIFV